VRLLCKKTIDNNCATITLIIEFVDVDTFCSSQIKHKIAKKLLCLETYVDEPVLAHFLLLYSDYFCFVVPVTDNLFI
jgi:hypothetical protein